MSTYYPRLHKDKTGLRGLLMQGCSKAVNNPNTGYFEIETLLPNNFKRQVEIQIHDCVILKISLNRT